MLPLDKITHFNMVNARILLLISHAGSYQL